MNNSRNLKGIRSSNDGFASSLSRLAATPFKRAYKVTVGNFDDVFLQIANVYTAFHLAALSILLAAVCGLYIYGLPATLVSLAAGILSYLFVGKLYNTIGNKGLGIIAGAHSAWLMVWLMGAFHPLWLTTAAALVTGAATYLVLYPLAYLLLRGTLRGLLDNRLGELLVEVHDRALGRVEGLFGK